MKGGIFDEIAGGLVGADVLRLVTAGLYGDPLAMYREYLQNAADAVGATPGPGRGRVDIELDPARRQIRIRDNGPGLSPDGMVRELIPIGRSRKRAGRDRGFLGIGRLAGLAFARRVRFISRASADAPVMGVTWDGERLARGIGAGHLAAAAIEQSVSVERVASTEYPARFFEVQIDGVMNAAASTVLDRDRVREYIGSVCPVPFSDDFPYKDRIKDCVRGGTQAFTLDAYVTGNEDHVTRPHRREVRARAGRSDALCEFEEICVPAFDDQSAEPAAAVGWLLHTMYLGALPKETGVGGIRARCGNIQIGSDGVFAHLFSERRFNQWCVGEIHVVDPRIMPNGKRDYFESSPYLRHLENHLRQTCQRLERRCRNASQKRNASKRLKQIFEEGDETWSLVTNGYLEGSMARGIIEGQMKALERLRQHDLGTDKESLYTYMETLDSRLNVLSGGGYDGAGSDCFGQDVAVYRQVIRIIAQEVKSAREARRIIRAIAKVGEEA